MAHAVLSLPIDPPYNLPCQWCGTPTDSFDLRECCGDWICPICDDDECSTRAGEEER